MKNQFDKENLISTSILAAILFTALVIFFSSCSGINKLFNKEKVNRDSTSIVHERKDSTATNDNISLHKDSSKETNETIIDFGDSKITIPYKSQGRDSGIYYWPNNPNDYFEITKDGIKTNRIPKSVTIKGSSQIANYDSLVNHSKISVSEVKNNETKVSEKSKTVTNEVHKKKFNWWLLLLIPVYLIFRNWPKIKQLYFFIRTFLKF